MNSAHSAWPCFENVHDPTSVTCRRRRSGLTSSVTWPRSPTKQAVPHERTERTAAARASGAEEASSVLCAPSPCVSSRIAPTMSCAVGSITSAAPNSWASLRRSDAMSMAMTRAPISTASCVADRPTGPWPKDGDRFAALQLHPSQRAPGRAGAAGDGGPGGEGERVGPATRKLCPPWCRVTRGRKSNQQKQCPDLLTSGWQDDGLAGRLRVEEPVGLLGLLEPPAVRDEPLHVHLPIGDELGAGRQAPADARFRANTFDELQHIGGNALASR